ncbi:MAG: hypothetical protein DMG78_14895 [Acidobacteria bacterium]|nr:MAG: hypothetical protein DMG78_14895 [Acidobacteriota bacterium]
MPRALDTVTGFVTAPGAVFTPWTMATGDTLAVRAAMPNSNIWLVGAWAWNQVAGVMRVRSPRLHDNVQGIRMRTPVNIVSNKIPERLTSGVAQKLFTQDNLIVEQTGSAVGGQIETGSLLIWYDDVPGLAGRFIDQPTLKKNGVNIMGQEVSITTGVGGGYTGGVAVNSTNDNFKANTDYALVGGVCDTRLATISVRGVDVANLRVSFPGEPTFSDETDNWFISLTAATGIPMIPVFNSQNKGAIIVDGVSQQVAVTSVVTLFFVELAQGSVPGAALPAAQPGV